MKEKIYPSGVIHRLSAYLRYLVQLDEVGRTTVSSREISDAVGVNSAEIRRDLSLFKVVGKRGVGYNIKSVITQFNEIIGAQQETRIALIGAGHLGTAIVNYDPLPKHGFVISAIFDNDPKRIGQKVGDLVVKDIRELKNVVKRHRITTAILAVSPEAAQEVTDLLVDAGVKVILNYTPVRIEVPLGVIVQTTDPVEKLLHTLYYLNRTGQGYSAAG